ncbi:MAG TPA: hypothetical protein VFB69_01605 [Candidatus Dormibacteraeota bacterium]|nr:hypothetical protein [Candidatus Dormibacteraeota bacterium]
MSQQLARSGIDPDQTLTPMRRRALIAGVLTIVLASWQAVAGTKGPLSAMLPLLGFFAELAAIAVFGFCALFAATLGFLWVGRRLSIW